MMVRTKICAVKNCTNTSKSIPKRRFFKFPKKLEWAKKWLTVCKLKVQRTNFEIISNKNSYYAVCDIHFEDNMFGTETKNRLRSKALPTIIPEGTEDPIDSAEDPTDSQLTEEITIKEEPLDDIEIKEECLSGSAHSYQHENYSSKPIVLEHKYTYSSSIYGPHVLSSVPSTIIQSSNDKKVEYLVCKTCLAPIYQFKCTPLYQKINSKKTIREMLEYCVPQMAYLLSDEDYICRKCLKNFRMFVEFTDSAEKKMREIREKIVSSAKSKMKKIRCDKIDKKSQVSPFLSTDKTILKDGTDENNSVEEISIKDEPLSGKEGCSSDASTITKNLANKPSHVTSRLIDWYGETVPCKTCLVSIYSLKSAPLNDKCHPQKTIKEMIAFCIPHMEPFLSDKDFICGKCLKSVRLCVKFIEELLEIEKIVREGKTLRELEFVEVPMIKTEPEISLNHEYSALEDYIIPSIKSDQHEATCQISSSKDPVIFETGSRIAQTDPLTPKLEVTEFSCDRCWNVYLSRNELEDHQRKMHCVKREDPECQSYNFNFTKHQHRLMHTGYCTLCQKRISKDMVVQHMKECKRDDTNSGLNDHINMQDIPRKERNFLCHLCGCSLELQSDLEAHLRLHSKPNIFICDICSKSFRKFMRLKYHKMYSHNRVTCVCKYCGKMMWNYTLLKHYKSYHFNEIKYFCKICGEAFMRIHYYKRHLRTHILMGHAKVRNKQKLDNSVKQS